MEVQRGMADREPEVPEERRIRFRIGINLGDVIQLQALSTERMERSDSARSGRTSFRRIPTPVPSHT